MELLVILVVIVIALGVLSSLGGKSKSFEPPSTTRFDPAMAASYAARPSLFVNASESAMFAALDRAAPHGLRVMAKVRLEDVIAVKPSVSGKEAWGLRARVKSRHVDFLVVDLDGRPRVAVELDGKSHGRRSRNADDLKDALFAATGVPLVRVRVGEDFAASARKIFQKVTPA